MATPGRHGVNWGQSQPAPAAATGRRAAPGPTQIAPPAKAPEGVPFIAGGVIPVQVLRGFYQNLPGAAIQQVVKETEVFWDQVNFIKDTQFFLQSFQVPEQYVYVFTDVLYYATAPGPVLASPPVQFTTYQLIGILRLTIDFNGNTPLRIDSDVYSPYDSPPGTLISRTGWGPLDSPFGVRRGNFAVYARSGQVVNVIAHVDTTPRFPITRVGAHLHGFAVPEGQFETITGGKDLAMNK